MNILKKFYYLIFDKKVDIIFLIGLTIFMSLLEITGITMVGSYIAYIADPESINLSKYFEFINSDLLNIFESSKNKKNLFGFVILFILLIRFILQSASNYFIFCTKGIEYTHKITFEVDKDNNPICDTIKMYEL